LTAVTQKPFVQGTPLQHIADDVHCWPYCEQVVLPPPPPVGPPLLPVPLSMPPVVVPEEPHVPAVEPEGMVQGSPLQQSAVVVQLAPVG
jgi:hypothetical protein